MSAEWSGADFMTVAGGLDIDCLLWRLAALANGLAQRIGELLGCAGVLEHQRHIQPGAQFSQPNHGVIRAGINNALYGVLLSSDFVARTGEELGIAQWIQVVVILGDHRSGGAYLLLQLVRCGASGNELGNRIVT